MKSECEDLPFGTKGRRERGQKDSNLRAFYRLWFSRPAHSSALPYPLDGFSRCRLYGLRGEYPWTGWLLSDRARRQVGSCLQGVGRGRCCGGRTSLGQASIANAGTI